MKAVMPEVPPHIVEWRRRTGADRWDEMWEGVLHMPPAPDVYHQDFQWSLETWLRNHWAKPRRGKVLHDVNVAPPGEWPNNYRIPDLVLLTSARRSIARGACLEGPPDVVIELRSPGDETMEKLPFFESLGVPEVWIVGREAPELTMLLLGESGYREHRRGADGWLESPLTGVRLRWEGDGLLAIEMAGQPETRQFLPED